MRALIYKGPYQMPLEEVDFPTPESDEIIIKVRAVGICGSDVHGYRGTTGRRKPPIIMGHEFSGVVAATGKNVTDWKPGDRVVSSPLLTCGICDNCLSGHPNICENRHCLGVDIHGAYAEAVCVHQSMVHALPDNVSFEQASMVEPLAVAMHAVNQTPFQLSESVVIIGAGTIGLLSLMAAEMKGAGQIFVIDTDEHRLEFARKLGATHVINSKEADPIRIVKDLTHGSGANAVIEAVGITATASQSLYLVKNGAYVTWIGNSQPEIQINMQQIVTRELHLNGSYGFIFEFAAALEAIQLGKIDPMVLAEKYISLEETGQVIDDLARGKVSYVKVIINHGFSKDESGTKM